MISWRQRLQRLYWRAPQEGLFSDSDEPPKGKSLLNAPVTADQRAQLRHRGRDHLRMSGIVLGTSLVVFIALLIAALTT